MADLQILAFPSPELCSQFIGKGLNPKRILKLFRACSVAVVNVPAQETCVILDKKVTTI